MQRCARVDERLRGRRTPRIHRHRVTMLHEIQRHRASHDAQSYESKFHPSTALKFI
jgi:hypothetical protein